MATAKSGIRVLVTGGTGFVGMHTVLALHHAGHDVCLYVRNPGKMERVFKPFGLHNLEHIVGDIIDRKTVNRALKNRDAVVHSAAIVNVHAKDARKTIRVLSEFCRYPAPPHCSVPIAKRSTKTRRSGTLPMATVVRRLRVTAMCDDYRVRARRSIPLIPEA
jgi:hypothetical protein